MTNDLVTLKTDTLAELMGMALIAANTGLLPADAYERWLKFRLGPELGSAIGGLENGWIHRDIGVLNDLVDSWVQHFKAHKAFEKNLEACFDKEEEEE